jgi:hypothetical protein
MIEDLVQQPPERPRTERIGLVRTSRRDVRRVKMMKGALKRVASRKTIAGRIISRSFPHRMPNDA